MTSNRATHEASIAVWRHQFWRLQLELVRFKWLIPSSRGAFVTPNGDLAGPSTKRLLCPFPPQSLTCDRRVALPPPPNVCRSAAALALPGSSAYLFISTPRWMYSTWCNLGACPWRGSCGPASGCRTLISKFLGIFPSARHEQKSRNSGPVLARPQRPLGS